MRLLQSGVDITVIALWLGHEDVQTTHVYLQADLAMKTFGNRTLSAEIKERTAVSEATAKHKSIYEMNDANAAAEFKLMSREVLKRIGMN